MVLLHDVWVMLATSSLPLALVACTEILKDTNRLSSASARKFLHIATGTHTALIEAQAGKWTQGNKRDSCSSFLNVRIWRPRRHSLQARKQALRHLPAKLFLFEAVQLARPG
jgi:hypothetical protein